MNYHPDDFLALTDAVEQEGGYVQPDPCVGATFKLKMPSAGRVVWRRFHTAHCNRHARLAVPYDPTVHVKLEDDRGGPIINHHGEKMKGAHFAAVCAVDDAVGLWPRYKHIMSDRSYQS